MDQVVMEAKGVNGQLELLENKIRIRRKGLMALATQGIKGDKEIFIKQITSVQIKNASALINGFIQFVFVGGQEAKGGLLEAGKDENTVTFSKKQQPEFEAIKSAIEERLVALDQAPVATQASTSLDELKKLADLKSEGIITQEEFDAKKKQLLGV